MFVILILFVGLRGWDNEAILPEKDITLKNGSTIDSTGVQPYIIQLAGLTYLLQINSELKSLWSDKYTFQSYFGSHL